MNMVNRVFLVAVLVAGARLALADAAIPGEPAPGSDGKILRCATRLERLRNELAVRYPFFRTGTTIIANGHGVRWETEGPMKPWRAGGGHEKYSARFERDTAKSTRPDEWKGMRTWVSGGPPVLDYTRGARGYVASYGGEGNEVDEFARVIKPELERCLADPADKAHP
jgi:hypothetical protein